MALNPVAILIRGLPPSLQPGGAGLTGLTKTNRRYDLAVLGGSALSA